LEALSVIVRVPVLLPVAVGAKVILKVQVPWGGTVGLVQLFDVKLPVTETLETTRLFVPVLVMVRPCVEVSPTTTLPKATEVADKLAVVAPVVKRVDPLIVPEVAVIVEVPAEMAVASPAELMLAALVTEEVQVAEFVRLDVLPSE
jgi:hypothetical protein